MSDPKSKLYAAAGIAVLALAPMIAFAQSGTPQTDWDMAARIREEGLQRSQVWDIVSYMTDVIGPRLTLSQDMKKAHAWALETFTKLGLQNVALEPFMDYGVPWDLEYVSIHMLEPDYQMMVGYPLAHTPGTKGKLILPAVIADVQTKTELARLKGKLKGAAVLMTPPAAIDPYAIYAPVNRYTDEDLKRLEETVLPAPRPAPRAAAETPNPDLARPEDKLAFFKAEGALVVFQCPGGRIGSVPGYARPGTKDDKWSYEATLASLPILSVTPEHYNRMYRILKRGLPVKVEVEVRVRVGKEREMANNIVGEIPGSDLKDEVVMIGAHFDTWHASPSPSDDGAACAVALEAVRILNAVGAKPRRTIRVAWWGGEEQGLFGSGEYVKKHFGDPLDPAVGKKPGYDQFSAYFNMDYGAGAFRGIYLQGNEKARRMLAAWMAPFRDMGCWAISNQSVGSTDHVSFDRAGLPGFQFIQDRIPGTAGHTNLDFLDTIQPQDLVKNAVIMASFAWQAANADERVPRKYLSEARKSPGIAEPPEKPELFLPGIISGDQHDFVVRFLPGGSEFYLMRSDAAFRTTILRFRFEEGRWKEAGTAPIPFEGAIAYPSFSTDGQRIFFDGSKPDEAPDVWTADRQGEGWGKATPLGPEVNTPAVEMLVSVAANGNLYFSSNRPGGRGGFDLYVARKTAEGYAPAENLGEAINTPEFESHPFVAPDESVLLFDSRRGGGRGSNDVYISFKKSDGGWTPATLIPIPGINTPSGDMRPYLSPDGAALFFCSDRNGTQDIWWMDASFIQTMRNSRIPKER